MDTTVNQRMLMKRINHVMKGRYVVLHPIGKGGMSSVYLIQSNDGFKLQRALKLIDKTEYSGRVDYYGEIEALKSLRNVEAVTDIIEVLQDERYLYIVQELVEGESLRAIRDRRERISASGLKNLMYDLADAMGQLEERGILHRDIKPDNILVTCDGKVKIIDFGISAFADESLKQDRIPTGTRAYMAPELYKGARSSIQTDIYAFGATFYSLITLNPPEWVDTNAKQRIRHMGQELKRETSAGTAYIIEKCMRYDPKKRFRSFKEISACLQRLDAYDDILQSQMRQRKGKRIVAWLVSVIGVVCLFSGVYRMKQDHIRAYKNQITQAEDAYNAGSYSKAQTHYDDARKMDSQFSDAYIGLIQIDSDSADAKPSEEARKHEFQSIIDKTEQYMDAEPSLEESPGVLELLGNAYYESGKGVKKGNTDYDEEKYQTAEKHLKKAIREREEQARENESAHTADNQSEFAEMLLGQIYVDEKKDDAAEEMLTKLENSQSKYKDNAIYLQGWMEERNRNYSEAAEKYNQVLRNSEKTELKRKAANELGIIYLEKEKKYSTAIKMLEKALKDENLKNSFTLNVMLFNAYVNTGSLDGIIHQAQKLLAFNFPDSDLNDSFYKNQIMAYIEKKDFTSAYNVLNAWPENSRNVGGKKIYQAIISGSQAENYSFKENPEICGRFIKDYENAEEYMNSSPEDAEMAQACRLDIAYERMCQNKKLYDENKGGAE